MSKILLCTLNSTYQHTAFGLRYLLANMKDLQKETSILEFTISQNPRDIVERILSAHPKIVGFGVYIWNTNPTFEVISLLKKVAPEIIIVLGGPEISYETETQPHVQLADHIVKGEGDFLFYELCRDLLEEKKPQKILGPHLPDISEIQLPYDLYEDNDLKNRTVYVEASRGCPYKCEYCLSSLDKSVRNFPLEAFLNALEALILRGARTFKFVDRTFNLNPTISTKILNFFLERSDKKLFLHFEMVPDRLPQEIKSIIEKFPAGALQFEIGIQTWSPVVAANVSRRQNYEKIKENLMYLKEETKVHTHADLIVGLPGETWESFAHGFDELLKLKPDEIQVGLLKRLKGTPIIRHDLTYQMLYSPLSPFQILANRDLSFQQMQDLSRFAKFWDLVANSGNFQTLTEFLIEFSNQTSESPFSIFFRLSKFLHNRHGQGHGIALLNLSESLWRFLKADLSVPEEEASRIIRRDYSELGKRDLPHFLKSHRQNALSRPKVRLATPERQAKRISSDLES